MLNANEAYCEIKAEDKQVRPPSEDIAETVMTMIQQVMKLEKAPDLLDELRAVQMVYEQLTADFERIKALRDRVNGMRCQVATTVYQQMENVLKAHEKLAGNPVNGASKW